MNDDQQKQLAKKQRKAAALEQHRIRLGLEEALASLNGRAMLWHFLALARYGQNAHTGNALNTAFACGEMNVGLQIVALMGDVDPASFVRMQLERMNNELDRNTPDSRGNTSDDGPTGLIATDDD